MKSSFLRRRATSIRVKDSGTHFTGGLFDLSTLVSSMSNLGSDFAQVSANQAVKPLNSGLYFIEWWVQLLGGTSASASFNELQIFPTFSPDVSDTTDSYKKHLAFDEMVWSDINQRCHRSGLMHLDANQQVALSFSIVGASLTTPHATLQIIRCMKEF